MTATHAPRATRIDGFGSMAEATAGAIMRMALRPATPDDHDAIQSLEGLARSTRSLLRLDLAGTKPRHIVVAVTSGTVVGFASTTRQPDEVHVLDLVVAPPHRRTGIARSMLAWLASAAVAEGVTAMTLEVRVSNRAAQSLYAGVGFEDHGVRPGYYQDGEDAVIMWHHDLHAVAVGPAGIGLEPGSLVARVPAAPTSTPHAVGSPSAQ